MVALVEKGTAMGRYTTVTRTGHADAPAEQILALVSSTEGFTTINPHLSADPKLEITPFGASAGVGSGFAFRGKNGKGTQTVVQVSDGAVDYAIDMGAMGRCKQRISAVPSERGGAHVEWTMVLDAGGNPLLRIFGMMAGRVIGPTLETGIRNLSAGPSR